MLSPFFLFHRHSGIQVLFEMYIYMYYLNNYVYFYYTLQKIRILLLFCFLTFILLFRAQLHITKARQKLIYLTFCFLIYQSRYLLCLCFMYNVLFQLTPQENITKTHSLSNGYAVFYYLKLWHVIVQNFINLATFLNHFVNIHTTG